MNKIDQVRFTSTVTTRGQTTVPKELRDLFGIREGTELLWLVKDGVATYDKVTIPLGEFNLATRGTVDLVQKKLDVITYIPFGALTDEAAGLFNTNLGKIVGGAVPGLEKATMVPFRTKGTFEKQETKPDLELFGKEFLTNLRPDKAVGNVLEDLLKKKKDK